MYALTKMDIAALKSADTLVARYNRTTDVSRLEAIKDASDSNPWEQRHHVACSPSTTCYRSNGDSYQDQIDTACTTLQAYRGEPMETFLALLKVGDGIILDFRASCNNNYLNDAGIHFDQCYLTIVRNAEGSKPTRYTIMVATSLCPDNLARMCKVSTKPAYQYQAS